jgi:hypothetical protein
MGVFAGMSSDRLRNCLTLSALPIGSPEKSGRLRELLAKWTGSDIGAMIEEHPDLFAWSVSMQGGRLTAHALEKLRKIA